MSIFITHFMFLRFSQVVHTFIYKKFAGFDSSSGLGERRHDISEHCLLGRRLLRHLHLPQLPRNRSKLNQDIFRKEIQKTKLQIIEIELLKVYRSKYVMDCWQTC